MATLIKVSETMAGSLPTTPVEEVLVPLAAVDGHLPEVLHPTGPLVAMGAVAEVEAALGRPMAVGTLSDQRLSPGTPSLTWDPTSA